MIYRTKPHGFRGRIPPNIWDETMLSTFTDPARFALEIKSMAAGMSPEEILNYYNLTEEDLEEYDLWFFEANFNMGRSIALNNVTHNLIKNTNADPKAAIIYMEKFGSEEWRSTKTHPGNEAVLRVELDDS